MTRDTDDICTGRSPTDRAAAQSELATRLYRELHRIARLHMSRESAGHTLQATALINEAWLRLSGDAINTDDPTSYLALSATTMRRVLIDHARGKRAEKRGASATQVILSDSNGELAVTDEHVLELHEALERLGEFDPRSERALELQFFAGLSYDEIAGVMGVSRSTVYNDIQAGKAWLSMQFGQGA